jgi:hypothetical protein
VVAVREEDAGCMQDACDTQYTDRAKNSRALTRIRLTSQTPRKGEDCEQRFSINTKRIIDRNNEVTDMQTRQKCTEKKGRATGTRHLLQKWGGSQ